MQGGNDADDKGNSRYRFGTFGEGGERVRYFTEGAIVGFLIVVAIKVLSSML